VSCNIKKLNVSVIRRQFQIAVDSVDMISHEALNFAIRE
jgi:hypothetical protein